MAADCRGAGTGGACGVRAPTTFDSQVRIQPNSTTNRFGWFNTY